MKLPIARGKSVLAGVRHLMRTYRSRLLAVLAFQMGTAITGVALPWIAGGVIDKAQEGTTLSFIVTAVIIAGILVVSGAILTYFAEYNARVLGEVIFAHMREDLVDTVTHLPLSVVEEAGTGDLLGRTTHDIDQVQFMVRNGISAVLVVTTTIVITIVASVVTSPVLSLSLLVPIPLVSLLMRWYLPRTVPAYRASASAWANMSGVITETMDNAETVDAARLRHGRDRHLDESIKEVWRLERYTAWQRMGLLFGLVFVILLPVGLVVGLGAWLLPLGVVSAGQITTVALYAYQLRGPMWEFTFWIDQMQSAGASLARIFGVSLVGADRMASGEEPSDQTIKATEVRYSYQEGKEVLHGITLDLHPGERLAMVGPSGAGKSTFGRMLAGIHPPKRGTVTVGGVNLVDLEEESLQKQVVLVSQEHHVFVGTVADNLHLAKEDATEEEMWRSLKAVGAQRWVQDLPDGIATAVGAGGKSLSPAQAQQLALARIVLMDPHTLVLDEATSLIDPTAARSLEQSLAKVLSGRTVVAIAHRLYTAHDADRVALLVDGHLSELGAHQELVDQGGEYAKLWASWQRD